LAVLLLGLLLFGPGCGSEKDRNVKTGLDRPRTTQPGD
jgi:hypothetical protein